MEKENAILESKFNDADERRKKAKAALDDGRSKLSALIGTLQEREQDRLHEIARREAAKAAGHPEETNLVRCAWEEAHPDETCPMCSDDELRPSIRDAAGHVDQVDRLIYLQDTDEIVALVQDAGIRLICRDVVNAWSVEDRIGREGVGRDADRSTGGTASHDWHRTRRRRLHHVRSGARRHVPKLR
jgi:hypothetical protein